METTDEKELQQEEPGTSGNGSKIAIASAVTIGAEAAMAMAHLGGVGVIAGFATGALAWWITDEVEQASGKEVISLPALPQRQNKETGQPSLLSRMLTGRSVREARAALLATGEQEGIDDPSQATQYKDVANPGAQEWDESFDNDGGDDMPTPHRSTEMFLFSEVLRAGFTPMLDRLFLCRTEQGKDLFCAVKEPYHIALAGNTGGGKSSIMRMLMLQLCHLRVRVLMLNPHYTRYDIENDEDWTPFEPYLVHPPMECRKYEVIEHYLRAAAKDLIPQRLEKRANSQPVGKPYFIVIDELPSIVREIEDAPDYMRVILEEGRKVGVFLISAAQDFLIKTISPKAGGGSIRECYRTVYYVGGDPTTGKTLLDMPPSLIPEDALGKGVVMFRGVPSKKATQVFVPYVDNESLYLLLGPSTYKRTAVVAAPEQELARPSIPEQQTVPYLRAMPTMEELPMKAQGEERRESTGRFTSTLSPELQRAYDAYREGHTTSRALAPVMDIGKTKAAELLGQLKARKLIS